jgi:uncharacterized Zn finger protein
MANFTLTNVVFNTTTQHPLGGPPRTINTFVRSASVHCATCGHNWQAKSKSPNGRIEAGYGEKLDLFESLAGVHVECPSCGTKEALNRKILG